jgi:hypothetical protein
MRVHRPLDGSNTHTPWQPSQPDWLPSRQNWCRTSPREQSRLPSAFCRHRPPVATVLRGTRRESSCSAQQTSVRIGGRAEIKGNRLINNRLIGCAPCPSHWPQPPPHPQSHGLQGGSEEVRYGSGGAPPALCITPAEAWREVKVCHFHGARRSRVCLRGHYTLIVCRHCWRRGARAPRPAVAGPHQLDSGVSTGFWLYVQGTGH